ncbi:lipopolysaccharide biosynthesis protein [Mesobacillus maritimus]|uniref:lipopolysaccharide biosynthesis protein n=1 Tax=Mesobacillus maritimus TaxID=1643336 RepID=UPI0038514ECE
MLDNISKNLREQYKTKWSGYTLKSLLQRRFIKNVLTVASGTMAAQAITLIFSPIITRLYGPEIFGILGLFMSMIGIVGPITSLTYPIAIVLPREDSEAKGLIRLSLYIAIILSTIMSFILILFSAPIIKVFNAEMLAPYLLFIPIMMFLGATLQVTEQWLIRKKYYKVTAKVSVTNSLFVNISKTAVGFFHPVATSLIFITTIGNALNSIMLVWGARRSLNFSNKKKHMDRRKTKRSLFNLAKKYYDFPVYRAPEMFFNAISQGLPIIMLTTFFGPASAGFYAIGKRVMELPSQLVGRSVGDVFYPRITEVANEGGSISGFLTKATLVMAAVGLIPFGIIVSFGPFLFGLVFGEEWIVAGEYARWIALWSYFVFINIPSVKTLPVISAQRFFLFFSIISTVVRIATLAVGGYMFNSDIIAVALYAISGGVLNIILIVITILKSKNFILRRAIKLND